MCCVMCITYVCVCVQDFAKADSRCPDYVRDGFSKIYDLAKLGVEGIVLQIKVIYVLSTIHHIL